jgi:hypothetical protein
MRISRQLALLTTVLATLAVVAAPALASRPHEFSGTLGEHCLVEPGCTGAALFAPTAVAVNEATGDVYVLDKGETPGAHGRVVVFNKTGVFVSEFDGSGTLGEGTAAGSGTEPGEIPTGRFEAPEAIAVDNSCVLRKRDDAELTQKECEKQDPSNGDVYVADTGEHHRVIDKYSAEGKYLGQITAGEQPLQIHGLDGVAVEITGTVVVYTERPQIYLYSNRNPNLYTTAITPQPFGAEPLEPLGFAVDSKGNFYGASFQSGIPRVTKWGPGGEVLIEELGSGKPTGVAVQQTSDTSIIDTGKRLTVFNPEGSEAVERLGEEGGEEHLQAGAGVGVSAVEGFIYVADPLAGPVVVFGPSQATVPKVEGQSFKEVAATEAIVAATINPRSETNEAATEYHFQYGRCTTATTCESSGYEANVPVPDGQIAADFETHEVSVRLEGLQPGSTYHFRAIVKNAHGEGQPGVEGTFTTQTIGGELVLPDDRGWELVSPPDKQGAKIEPLTQYGVVQAAASGNGITYLANAPTEASPQGNANLVQVLSRRAAAAWSSRDIAIPHSGATGHPLGDGPEYKFFDLELSNSAVQPFGEFVPELSEEATESTAYLHNLGGSCGSFCFHPLVTGKAGIANVPAGTVFGEEELCRPAAEGNAFLVCGPQFLGATEDLSHVVVKADDAALTPGSDAIGGLYEWSGGQQLAPVSVLPGQEAATRESGLGSLGSISARGAISSDGERIAWTREKTETLYLRDMAREETVQVDAAQTGCGSCGSGKGKFQVASADGSKVFFIDHSKLTTDSGAAPGGGTPTDGQFDLYECRITIEADKLHCDLHDLTPKHGEEGAAVQGGILGASKDGSYTYFVAEGIQSEEANARGQKAQPGKANLYMRRDGTTRFIATLSMQDNNDWVEVPAKQPTRVSGDGRYLAFMSQEPLTGYDNRDRASGQPVAEVYLYDAETNRLECASCEPSGERPVGVEYKKTDPRNGGLVGGFEIWSRHGLVAANVAGWTGMTGGLPRSRHQPRYLTDEGRLFFNSIDALVPQDANGTQDVYEYEPPGVGNCEESSVTYSARSGGCVSLISSGSSARDSAFLDASESGDDVFFLTSAKLSPIDVDTARDVYDAHVCNDSPCISYAGSETPPCTTEASCKPSPTSQPSIFGAPASSTFQGLGNPAPAATAAKQVTKKTLTRAQKLAAALKACRKKVKSKRAGCEKAARKKYAPPKRPKKKGRK